MLLILKNLNIWYFQVLLKSKSVWLTEMLLTGLETGWIILSISVSIYICFATQENHLGEAVLLSSNKIYFGCTLMVVVTK